MKKIAATLTTLLAATALMLALGATSASAHSISFSARVAAAWDYQAANSAYQASCLWGPSAGSKYCYDLKKRMNEAYAIMYHHLW